MKKLDSKLSIKVGHYLAFFFSSSGNPNSPNNTAFGLVLSLFSLLLDEGGELGLFFSFAWQLFGDASYSVCLFSNVMLVNGL